MFKRLFGLRTPVAQNNLVVVCDMTDRRGFGESAVCLLGLSCRVAFLGIPASVFGEFVERRRLRFNILFENPYSRVLNNQVFWCFLPADFVGRQSFLGVDASSQFKVHKDGLGHNVVQIDIDHVPPYARRVVALTTFVQLSDEVLGGKVKVDDYSAWLKSERFIESDSEAVCSLARSLKAKSDLLTLKNVYEWVSHRLTYVGYLQEDLGALRALTGLRGDCTEFAYLVVALSRACGIPARSVGGYVVTDDAVLSSDTYHDWSEVFIDGQWQIVDAQKRKWMPDRSHYIGFRIHSDEHIIGVGRARRFSMQGELQVKY